VNLLRGDGPLLRIGHRGAAALAPPNSVAAVEAALELGVDMVELDVLGRPDRTLVLGHSRKELAPEPATLDDVFALLAERSPETGVVADIKAGGFERELVESLRAHGLVERAVVATSAAETLQAFRRLEPSLTRSLTYPRRRLRAPFLQKLVLPFRIHGLLEEVDAAATTLNRRLVSRATVHRCHALGKAVLVWTVNDRDLVRHLDEIGVDGVITDDPRLFGD
jgi:glycerophosphoryl diester phosphodiesterase